MGRDRSAPKSTVLHHLQGYFMLFHAISPCVLALEAGEKATEHGRADSFAAHVLRNNFNQ